MDQAEAAMTDHPLTVEGLEEIFVKPERVAQPFREGDATPTDGLTFKEACNFYGVKATALRVRIKSGEISAKKIEGDNGPEWRIYPQPSRNPISGSTQPLREPGTDILLEMLQDLQAKLDASNKQLQAASYRNGYLEAQLEASQETIKLLTDSQHGEGAQAA
jgi:hypothetical protein